MEEDKIVTKQALLTISAGKRLIAKAVSSLAQIQKALENHTIIIVAGTTNGYVAEELLNQIDQLGDFSRDTFFRGVTIKPGKNVVKGAYFAKDIVLKKGKWIKGENVFTSAPQLGPGDIILKGGNAVDAAHKEVGILIGHPEIGTSAPILQAVIGRRAELILPIGLEKRVFGDIGTIAAKLNATNASGVRMLAVSGTIVTELDALEHLTGVSAELVASGGIYGAEGSCWLTVTGREDQVGQALEIMKSIAGEPAFGA
ncbi:hypothetical protein SAMN05660742_11898 [Propionispira arboris]|uniref:Uncharacterized protein n=1 Tax=Propionispira arboris TaxID=84035 RepID=A0A1H7BZ35_9FIRM|nr:hypothetical protein [Propionispira arboris]SEJ82829.1 hypothetical protein SAMN05660742_11898 [Propionispira arboris]